MTKQFKFRECEATTLWDTARPIPNDQLSTLRRTVVRLARECLEAGAEQIAKDTTFAMANAWWSSACNLQHSSLEIRSPFTNTQYSPLPYQLSDAISDFANHAARVDTIFAAFEIGQTYASLLPTNERKSGGVFYTPPHIARKLVQQAEKNGAKFSNGCILEPSAGGGTLLLAALDRIIECRGISDSENLLATLPQRLVGLEIDPFSAWLAQVAVDVRLLPIATVYDFPLPKVVTVADSLQYDFQPNFDIVVMNPPFGRQKLSAELKGKFARSLHGHPNTYALFLDQSLRATKESGHIIALTPTSFLSGQYFKKLRSTLRSNASIREIGVFDTRTGIFDGVRQELAITALTKSQIRQNVLVNSLEIEPCGRVSSMNLHRHSLPNGLEAPWILPRTREQAPLAHLASRMQNHLKDWGYVVKTGPVVWNRVQSQLSDQPLPGSVPLVWASCIQPNGNFIWPPEARKDKAWLRIEPHQDHSLLKAPVVLLQRATSCEQPRRLNATLLPAFLIGEFGPWAAENHVNILEPISETPAVSLETLTAFLNSETADRIFRCLGGSSSVSAFELEALPLPSPARLGAIEELVAGKAKAIEIDAEIQRLYQSGPPKQFIFPPI